MTIIIDELYNIINDRKENMPEGSYIASLFKEGKDRIIQKVGEEAVEVVIAAKNSDRKRIIEESTDLIFHLLILLVNEDITIKNLYEEFEKRSEGLLTKKQ